MLHFPRVKEQIQDERDKILYTDSIEKLMRNFSQRFDSFTLGKHLLLLILNPYLIRDVREFSKEAAQTFKWVHPACLQLQLTDLHADVALGEHFEAGDPATFWQQIVPEAAYPDLTKTMFGLTYNCESAFSVMNNIKNKHRSTLTNEHLHMCMRMALTTFKLRFKLLIEHSDAHFKKKNVNLKQNVKTDC
ncbi:general transcription factor II-I repeat domain-containing protein 2A-like [Danio aesculapii]|uniref:general transcription factor II-I repeat domain-containing protein 2A-like n=1 Tax=Danio aesculapii TaxID=1142201 RepID=UPI0024C09909|nr:general transcription factor II-I repeat domain-containing protein 2A-like [Danio aesculapii]